MSEVDDASLHLKQVNKPSYGTYEALSPENTFLNEPKDVHSRDTIIDNYSIGAVAFVVLVLVAVTMTLVSDPFHWKHFVVESYLGRHVEMIRAQMVADHYRLVYLEGQPAEIAVVDDDKSGTANVNLNNKGPPEGCEGTVILLRHCDKGNLRDHCDYLGFERSSYLATLFGNGGERWPAPSYIFALNPSHRRNPKKQNYREVETVLPLADKFHLPITTKYTVDDDREMSTKIFRMLQNGKLCGKVAVISWKHSDIPHLARKLGCGPADGCPLDYPSSSYDEAWQIKFVYGIFPLHHTEDSSTHPEWKVFGAIQQEDFDPLAFSKQMGDYPEGGTPWGARWEKIMSAGDE